MTLVELIVYCVIASICGAIARAFVGGSRGGFVVSLLVGFVGAFIGAWLARQLHLPELLVVKIEGHPFPIVWSVVGGIVLVLAAHGLMRPGYASRFVR
jgi:uncharacterized membrane protein YeaQ/YmgE (transglycosylase-associated protein family)